MSEFSRHKKSRRAYWYLLAAAFGLLGLWAWLFETKLHGLVLRLVEQQFDIYYPDLTGLAMTIALTAVPLYMARRSPKVHEYELLYDDLVSTLKIRIVLLAVGTLLLAGLSAGVYKLFELAPTVDQGAMRVDLNSDASPNFILLRKVRLLNASPISKNATFSKDLRKKSEFMLRRYTPVASIENRQRPIRFVESITSNSTQVLKAKKVALEGFIRPRLLPAAIRSAFETDGLAMANTVYVFENRFFDIKPYLKWTAVILGFVALLLLIRLALSPAIHTRKLQRAWDHQRGYSKVKNVKDDIAPWS